MIVAQGRRDRDVAQDFLEAGAFETGKFDLLPPGLAQGRRRSGRESPTSAKGPRWRCRGRLCHQNQYGANTASTASTGNKARILRYFYSVLEAYDEDKLVFNPRSQHRAFEAKKVGGVPIASGITTRKRSGSTALRAIDPPEARCRSGHDGRARGPWQHPTDVDAGVLPSVRSATFRKCSLNQVLFDKLKQSSTP